jgi:hypothetical protein
MSAEFHAWIRSRVALAKRLNEGECDGYYGDAMLILSAVLSGLTADLWPGEHKDRRRFVEVWATHSHPDLSPNLISVPLLLDALEKSGDSDLVEKVRATRPEAFPPWKTDSVRVAGKQVDQTEDELIALDSRLAAKKLRHFSYGNVFYRHVRSGYTHEGHVTDSASSVSTAIEPAPISYMNNLRPPHRRIHFDVSWVAEIVESVSASVMALSHIQPFTDPKLWWVDG